MSNDMAGGAGIWLVRQLAVELYAEAQAYVPNVLAGRADVTPAHLAEFIRAQRSEIGAPRSEQFQLPEPILGPIPSKVEVLVVGLNPGYGPLEEIPALRSTLDEYVDWYLTRMDRRNESGSPISLYDGQPGIVRHYVAVERDYLTPVLGNRALGREAVYADAIPWKWNREFVPALKDPQIGLDARARIGLIASTVQPNLLVVFGGEPAKQLGTPWPSNEPTLSDVNVGEWHGTCLPVWHPNKHWLIPGEKRGYLGKVHAVTRLAVVGSAAPNVQGRQSTCSR